VSTSIQNIFSVQFKNISIPRLHLYNLYGSLHHSAAQNVFEADIVIIGVPDESRSHAARKGANKGPDIIRLASNKSEFFERDGNIIPICPLFGKIDNKHIFDYGNAKRENLHELISDLVSNNKIPIVLGGDHSITSIVLQAIGNIHGKIGLFYFDAHPDFVSSTTNYYGSVLTDSFQWIDFAKSMLIGTRAAEPEELDNATRVGLEVITPLDISESGISQIANRVEHKNCSNKKYISIDLDCIDPLLQSFFCFPMWLISIDLVYLIKLAISSGIIGIDLVELP
jgi:agmatinase